MAQTDEHQRGKPAQALRLSSGQLRAVRPRSCLCSQAHVLLDAGCLDALWKVGRADQVLLWNKCSRAQGLQLEKAPGEAA